MKQHPKSINEMISQIESEFMSEQPRPPSRASAYFAGIFALLVLVILVTLVVGLGALYAHLLFEVAQFGWGLAE